VCLLNNDNEASLSNSDHKNAAEKCDEEEEERVRKGLDTEGCVSCMWMVDAQDYELAVHRTHAGLLTPCTVG